MHHGLETAIYSQSVANELPLLFGVGDSGKTSHESLRCIDHSKVDAEVLADRLLDFGAFVEPHKAVVHEDGMAIWRTRISLPAQSLLLE